MLKQRDEGGKRPSGRPRVPNLLGAAWKTPLPKTEDDFDRGLSRTPKGLWKDEGQSSLVFLWSVMIICGPRFFLTIHRSDRQIHPLFYFSTIPEGLKFYTWSTLILQNKFSSVELHELADQF